MNKLLSFGLFILVSSLFMSSITNSSFAQNDPSILLKIATNAQYQINNQLAGTSSESMKTLFNDGKHQVLALDKSLQHNDIDSAKKHFLSAMNTFKHISKQLTQPEVNIQISVKTIPQNPISEFLKTFKYVSNLKLIAEKYSSQIDFSEIDELFLITKNQIISKQFNEAQETIDKIKQLANNIKTTLGDQTNTHKSIQIKTYAQKYLKQFEILIEYLKNQNVSEEFVDKLEISRNNLSNAVTTKEIIKEIKTISIIKKQFELTKIDEIKAVIFQMEKAIDELSNNEQVNANDLRTVNNLLEIVKYHLSMDEFKEVYKLLKNLTTKFSEIENSFS